MYRNPSDKSGEDKDRITAYSSVRKSMHWKWGFSHRAIV